MRRRKNELDQILVDREPRVFLMGRRADERYADDDLSALAGWPIEQLALQHQQITKLPPLQPSLKILSLDELPELASLDGLEKHTSLQRLSLGALPKIDLADAFDVLAELPELTALAFSSEHLRELPRSLTKLPSVLEVELFVGDLDLDDAFATLAKVKTLRNLELHARAGTVLPASLGKLANLVKLDLEGSKLTALPKEIGKLTKLEELNIKYSRIASLPDEICACVALRVIDANNSELKSLPAQIGTLKNLRTLDVWTKALRSVPASIGELAELRELRLPIRTRPRLVVPDSIYKLQLETFTGPDWIENKLTLRPPPTPMEDRVFIDDPDRIPDDFGDPIELAIRLPDYTAPLPQLSKLRRLKELELEVGNLDDAFQRLTSAEHLAKLEINGTYTKLPDSIGDLVQIETLDLDSGHQVYTSEPGTLNAIPDAIAKLVNLKSLGLKRHAMKKLPDAICKLAALEDMRLAMEPFTDLPKGIGALKRLRALKLFDIGGLERLPKSLAECTALATFSIWGCYKTCPIENLALLGDLPALRTIALTRIHELNVQSLVDALAGGPVEGLDLSGTNIGKLPTSIGKLAKLQKLELDGTDVKTLPPSLRDCTALIYISLPIHNFDRSQNIKDLLPEGRWKKNFRSHVTWYERSA